MEAAQKYGAAGPFIVVVVIFVAFLVIAGVGLLRYLSARDAQHSHTVASIVADVKASAQLAADAVTQCTANQIMNRRKGR